MKLGLAYLLVGLLACLGCAPGTGEPAILRVDGAPLRIGVGDRISVERGDRWLSVPEEALAAGLDLDLFAVWLTRDWQEDWVTREALRDLVRRGITPVVVHYYFGDDISKERLESDRDDWYTSLWRMSQLVDIGAPVLVVLEPEFNVVARGGETSITEWPWFGDDLRAAALMIKGEAPEALVGVCAGDFSPTRDLEPVLERALPALDFLAFQEMRASTDPASPRSDYLSVGAAAVDYATYLQRSFRLPVLLAYVAVSSHGGWEARQAEALADLAGRRAELSAAGVFGAMYFQLHDDPAHVGYFGEAERHFGLLRSDGSPKPALQAFRALGSARSREATRSPGS